MIWIYILQFWQKILFFFNQGCNALFDINMIWYKYTYYKFIPGLIIFLCSLFLSDTPNSLIERDQFDEAKVLLKKIRGIDNVVEEFNDLAAASEASKLIKNPWRYIFRRKYRPQLSFAFLIPSFQQLTGVNVFVFYAPVLFKSVRIGDKVASYPQWSLALLIL